MAARCVVFGVASASFRANVGSVSAKLLATPRRKTRDIVERSRRAVSSLPDTVVRRYEHGANWIEITPSVKGLATIHDKDILIYCISQVMAALKRGEKVSRRVRVNSADLLRFTNRGTGGREYRLLVDALDRLEGTRIRTGDHARTEGFGLIDASAIERRFGLNGRMLWCEVVLSDWVFNAIRANEVLTLHRDYFRLRKPLERRVYEMARKHCGTQKTWRISVDTLRKKSGPPLLSASSGRSCAISSITTTSPTIR